MKSWKNVFSGIPVFILGNGPSLKDWDLSILDNFFTIGINRIIDIYHPTILLWQDELFWQDYSDEILNSRSIKASRQNADPKNIAFHFNNTGSVPCFSENPEKLHGSGSSGHLAVQLAYAMGCRDVVLVGYDCGYRGKDTDFYGVNRHHTPHSMDNCRKGLKWLRKENKDGKVNIVNCSNNGMWNKESLSDAVDRFKKHKNTEEYYRDKLL